MINGYSICLNEWALDKDIKNELGLLLIISSLCSQEGYCFASNKYLGELFNENEITICRKIKKLEDKKYIVIKYEKRGCEIVSREIRLTKLLIDDYQNRQSSIDENAKENNISIMNDIFNTTDSIIEYKESIEEKEIKNKEKENEENIDEIIEYLNLRANTHYRKETKTTKKYINALLKNYTIEEIKEVIDKKCLEWLGTPYEKYLRPETLFGNKFEGYLNAKVNVSINKVVSIVDNDEEWGDFL